MRRLLFEPCGMAEASFFLPDGDPRAERIPTLYGAPVLPDGSTPVLPEPECLPSGGPPVLNGTAHAQGPRKYDAGDTGSIMPASDYAKFYEMLLNNGVSPVTGERLLSPAGVQLLCKGRLSGLNLDVGMARAFGMAGAANERGIPRSFNFGWATSHPVGVDELVEYATNDHPDMSNWGGYAANQGAFYLNEDAYILICPQVMLSTPGGNDKGAKLIRDDSFKVWHSVWS